MKKILMFFAILMLSGVSAFSQSRTITGTVIDENGTPVINATVLVKGSTTGTSTKNDGSFSILVPPNGKALVISSVGFETKDFPIGSSNVINATLFASNSALDEVVIVGYGTGRQLGTVVGSVTKVSDAVIKERPTANVLDALQGKVAGLQVLTSSGEPSELSSVSLHGIGSLGASSTPLYVLDGIPIPTESILSLNSQDFESVTVLKDASATSIYGSRAANGVIYITTKKGSTNKPASISLQTQYGFSNLISTDYFNNFLNSKGLTDFLVDAGYETRADMDDLLAEFPNDTKWYKSYYRENAPTFQSNLSVSGGSGKTSYYISGGYFKQEGLAYRSAFERFSLRTNVTTKVNDWMKMGLNVSMGFDKRQVNPYGSNSTNRGLALLAPPYYSPVDANGKKYPDIIPGWNRYNPEYLADKNPSEGKRAQLNPTGYIEITPIKNLTLKTQAGLDASDYNLTSLRLPSYIGSINNGSASENFTRISSKTVTNTAEYKFRIKDDHSFVALAGQEYTGYVANGFGGSSTGQTDDRLILISNGPSNKNASSFKNEYSYLSYFGRLEYDYNKKYFLNGSIRQDQSSRFGKDNRTATFWSVGGMWKVKQEEFLSGVQWLTDLSVRATYGTSGNSDIGNYQSLALVGTSQYNGQTGWGINSPGNPNLSWESQKQANFGISLSLWNRVNLEVEYYDRTTSNMLLDVPYPYTSGFSEITSNVGSLKNSGIDFTLSGDALKTKDAYITPYINFNYNKNKVTELFQGKQYWIIPNTGVSWAVGQPVSFFYPIFAGINPQNGLAQWYEPNADKDKIIDTRKDPKAVSTDFVEEKLEQNTGINRYAPFNGGFGLSSGYKGLSLSVDFSFSQGKYLINNDRYFFENPNVFYGFNQTKNIQNFWKKPGDVTEFPNADEQFTQFDSRLIEDASFLRMKGITLGYSIGEEILSRTNFFKGARFYVTGRNLLTVTNYSGPDPEVNSNLTLGANPNTKQVVFGLDITL